MIRPMTLKITTIGEVLIDLTQTVVDSNSIVNFAANPGGAPANVAVAASRLGVPSAFVGCVGKDSFGEILRKTLSENNVDISGLQETEKASTTIAVVTVSPDGERSFSFLRKPGADLLLDENRAYESVRGTGMLHFGSVSLTEPSSRKTIINVVKKARGDGSIITYDPNYRSTLWKGEEEAKKHMRKVLPLCDVVKISDEETVLLTGKKSPQAAAEALIRKGVSLVLVTLGKNGAYFKTKDCCGTVPGYSVKVADTNGAGDTFFGALLSRLAIRGNLETLKEEEMRAYVDFANKAASITTSRRGAIPAMPYLKELV